MSTAPVYAPRRRGDARHLHVIGTRRAAASGPEALLIERTRELDVLGEAVTGLAEGEGSIVVLAAPAGLGKTALLEHAAQEATRVGGRVRRAAPGPLERHFGFGVVRALLEGALREASDERRARLLEGAAAPAGALLRDGAVPAADATMAIAHSVLWLCSALADEAPLMLVVDDAHWADRPSLEVLAYVARRIDELPLLIAIGARADDPDASSDLLSLIGGARAATVLHPQPLTRRGAARLIRRAAPSAPLELCRECHRAAAGNPWLLGELGRQIADHGVSALDASGGGAAPLSSVARTVVRARLAELSARDRAVVEALAVIGEGAPRQVVAAVAGVALGDLGGARDGLVAAGLLAAGGAGFAHHLIASAIADDLPRGRRERLHRETARALMATGADDDSVASHLLRCGAERRPRGQRAAAPRRGRRRATRRAPYRRGVPRARAEGARPGRRPRAPAGRARGGRLRRRPAGVARAPARGPGRGARPRQPARRPDPAGGAERRGPRRAGAVGALRAGAGLGDRSGDAAGDRGRRARHAHHDSGPPRGARPARGRHRRRGHRRPRAAPHHPRPPRVGGRRARRPGAAAVAALAREALDGDELLHDAGRRAAYHLATRALVLADHDDEAHAAIVRLRDHAVQRGSLRLHAAAAWYAADLALRRGRLAEAEDEARSALCLVDDDVSVLTGGSASVLVATLAERGAFDEARDVLRERGLDGAMEGVPWQSAVIHARARLWLAEGDYERALAEALASGALGEERGRPNPTWTPWRSTAALALAHLGRREEAVALADAELALAERFGAPVPIAGALHARAVAEPDAAARVALCERALAVAAGTPALLEAVRARLVLGSTLAHTGRRIEARDALRPALADADAVGAVLLAQRARRELVATGLRPRQAATEGAAALTPRQRQVCELAAAGKGNRQIAQALFLSIKTVETHLAAGYRKLGVGTRAELAAQLAR